MQAVPRRMVTIWKWRVPITGLFYLFMIVLVGISLVLPWSRTSAVFQQTHPVYSSKGHITIDIFLWGAEIISVYLYGIDIDGNPTEFRTVFATAVPWYITIFLLMGCTVLGLYIYLLLGELGIINIEEKRKVLLEVVSLFLMLGTLVGFEFGIENMSSAFSSYTVGVDRYAIFGFIQDIRKFYYYTAVSFSLGWAPGYAVFFAAFFVALVAFLDRRIAREKLDLSWYWRLRFHLSALALLALFFPIADHIEYRGLAGGGFYKWGLLFGAIRYGIGGASLVNTYFTEKGILALPSIEAIMLSILLATIMVIVIMTVRFLPSRHLTKATPFITLALPEDEIMRRHKMLPIVSRWLRVMDWLIALVSIVAIYVAFRLYVWQLGVVDVTVVVREKIGVFWTTIVSYIAIISLVIQFLMTLIPIRRGA